MHGSMSLQSIVSDGAHTPTRHWLDTVHARPSSQDEPSGRKSSAGQEAVAPSESHFAPTVRREREMERLLEALFTECELLAQRPAFELESALRVARDHGWPKAREIDACTSQAGRREPEQRVLFGARRGAGVSRREVAGGFDGAVLGHAHPVRSVAPRERWTFGSGLQRAMHPIDQRSEIERRVRRAFVEVARVGNRLDRRGSARRSRVGRDRTVSG